MKRFLQIGAAGAVMLALAGCANAWSTLRDASLALVALQPRADQIVSVHVPGIGFVRGTRTVLAGLGAALVPAEGPNRAVEACRAAAWVEAAKLGARDLEAVSAGPERQTEDRRFVAPVRMRVTYYKPVIGFEVREATMTCAVDAEGNLVRASA